jgi:phage tail tape-measure protein
VAGELAGGAAGGWVGGAYGAALGTMLLPGIGTVIGGAIGAMVGGFGGGELGKIVGEELGKSSVTDKISEKPAGESYVANSDQQIIDLLTKQYNESEKIRILQQKSNSHLDDIKSLDDFNKLKLK